MADCYGDILHNFSDKRAENLPVKWLQRDVSHNPEFAKLLSALSQQVTPEGTSVGLQRDLSEAREALDQQKQRWLQNNVLYAEIQELILDHQLQGAESTPTSTAQFYKVVGDMLTYSEIGDYLDCAPDAGTTLLGLTHDELDHRNPHKKHRQSVQQKLIPEIELRLRKRCEALVSFHDLSADGSSGGDENVRFAFAKASQLPAIVDVERRGLEEERAQLKGDRTKREQQLSKYYQTLMESLETLTEVLSKHRLQSQPDCDDVTSEWLLARADAMCLKIKILELQLVYDTYYADTLHALHSVGHELNSALSNTQLELSRSTGALRSYEVVGDAFDAIVDEFTRLRDELDNKKWALHEMKKHQLTSDEQLS